jgi:hypothetical protein
LFPKPESNSNARHFGVRHRPLDDALDGVAKLFVLCDLFPRRELLELNPDKDCI